jgi:MarR-like DNA-binding transcriptional regulator SgrR of sgrS sRNA
MIADDFLAEAKVQIDAGDHATADAYLNAASAALSTQKQSARAEVVRAAAQAALDDFDRIETARRLCRYAVDTGRGGRATLRFLRAMEQAPKPDLRQPITSAANARAFAWHTQNRANIQDLIHEAAEEAAQGSRLS